jgi:hypothetical protein
LKIAKPSCKAIQHIAISSLSFQYGQEKKQVTKEGSCQKGDSFFEEACKKNSSQTREGKENIIQAKENETGSKKNCR